MNLNKSTRYALHSMLDFARADDRPVTVAVVAARHGIPAAALAKVLQQLVRAGLARGSRGIGGGYRLARPASEVTVQDVIDVFESSPGSSNARPAEAGSVGPPGQPDRLRSLFAEVDETIRSTFRSVTFETLVR